MSLESVVFILERLEIEKLQIFAVLATKLLCMSTVILLPKEPKFEVFQLQATLK